VGSDQMRSTSQTGFEPMQTDSYICRALLTCPHEAVLGRGSAPHRKVPLRQIGIASCAGAERLSLSQALPQPRLFVPRRLAQDDYCRQVIGARKRASQDEQRRRRPEHLGEHGLQHSGLMHRFGTVAQDFTEAMKLLNAAA
jgi:hypothetical protein